MGLLDKFQYCNSNIELFSIAPSLFQLCDSKVVALNYFASFFV